MAQVRDSFPLEFRQIYRQLLREQLDPKLKGRDRARRMTTINNRALAELSKRHPEEYDRFYNIQKSS